MAVLCTFREPFLCRHVHYELMRGALLDLTPVMPATACHQRNYVERYGRYSGRWRGRATAWTVLRLVCAVGMRYNGGRTSWTHT